MQPARVLLVATLCLSVGVQWVVIQGVAWTTMLISFSQNGTLIEAVEKTFDGDHPCPLCCAVKEGKAKENQQEQEETLVKKMDAVLASICRVVPPAPTTTTHAPSAWTLLEALPQMWWLPPRV